MTPDWGLIKPLPMRPSFGPRIRYEPGERGGKDGRLAIVDVKQGAANVI